MRRDRSKKDYPSFKEIGARLNISPFMARYIYDTAIAKLKKECIKRGITFEDIIYYYSDKNE